MLYILVFVNHKARAQHPKFDKLEQLYHQNLYSIVYRKSKRMIKDDEYKFSKIPQYYFSLTSIQKAQNLGWAKRHNEDIKAAFEFLIDLKSSQDGRLIFESHNKEIVELKISIGAWLTNLKLRKNNEFDVFDKLTRRLMNGVHITEIPSNSIIENNRKIDKKVQSMIGQAESLLGVPYVYGGDSPKGFDCSGFTQYLYHKIGISIPRIAGDQYKFSKKIKQKEIEIGDLVFFSHGGPVAHVGMIYDFENDNIQMIHASSSKGIQIISLTKSKYWKSRIVGFGKIIQ